MHTDESEDPVELGVVTCLLERPKAIMVGLDNRPVWIPKSVLHDNSEVFRLSDNGKLIVKYWWADKEGYV